VSMWKGSISGRIAKDAEIKTTPKGDTICEFSIPHEERKGDPTVWIRCSLWGKRGEALCRHLTKGTFVTVVGTQKIREYEGKGGKAFSAEIKADDVALLGGGERSASEDSSSRYQNGHGGGAKHSGADYSGDADGTSIPF
jgi:single-strand DNA-binding protein